MHRLFKHTAAALLAASLVFGQAFTALADEEVMGPGAFITEDGSSTAPQETDSSADQGDTGSQQTEGQTADTSQQETESEQQTAQEEIPQEVVQANTPYTQAQVYRHDNVWSDPVVGDGVITAGDAGFRSACIYLNNIVGDIYYRTFTSSYGWTPWAMNGGHTLVFGEGTEVEAIQIKLVGFAGNRFSIYYSTTLSDGTQLDWTKDGGTSGTMGQGKSIRTLRLALWGKEGEAFPYSTERPLDSAAYDGVITGEGVATYSNGNGAPFTGWGWNYRDRYYFVDNQAVTGWQYIDGYKYYFDETGKLVTDLEPLIGTSVPFLIKINKEMNTTTVYAQDGANGFIIPVKTFLCSAGDDTPLGTYQTPAKYRWHLMINDVYCQYLTRITGSFLMHSLIYDRPDPYTMWPETYNYLGVARSAGCIRFKTEDAKWIYDNCSLGTTVEIYNSSVPGPYERPAIEQIISMDQHYDPTDPNLPENQG